MKFDDSYYGELFEDSDVVIHEGRGHDDNPPGRGSGLYPWGSGKNPFQRSVDFYEKVQNLKARYPGITNNSYFAA